MTDNTTVIVTGGAAAMCTLYITDIISWRRRCLFIWAN